MKFSKNTLKDGSNGELWHIDKKKALDILRMGMTQYPLVRKIQEKSIRWLGTLRVEKILACTGCTS